MHIKHIHDMIEKLSECAKCELDKGIEKIDTKEMGEVAEIIKELAEAEYYAKISKAMDEAEYGEDYDWKGAYDEHERKGYRGQPRDSRGRYMSRRGYESNRMMPIEWDDMEQMRDMDRSVGKMYYSSSNSNGSQMNSNSNSNMGSRGYSESGNRGNQSTSRSENARRNYTETKHSNKANGMDDKQANMKNLEEYMKELSTEMTDLISDMDASEKQLLKQKMSTLMQKIQ